MQRYDAIVVGSGATGGWAAKTLAEGNLRVLLLEAGGDVSPAELTGSVPAISASIGRQPVQSRLLGYYSFAPHLFVDDLDNPYTTPKGKPFTWIRGRQMGGRTLVWNGVALRFSDCELQPADGRSDPWPIRYADLKPYYDEVERFYGVYGSSEGLANLPDGLFQPPRPLTQGEMEFKSTVEYRWADRRVIPTRGIPDIRQRDASWPAYTSQGSALHAARQTENLTVRTDAVVSCIKRDSSSERATGVVFVDRTTRKSFEADGKVIVLCASTIESTRLLLNSGIGNSSGLLGCFLMDHVNTWIAGVVPRLCGQPLAGDVRGAIGALIPNFRNVTGRCPGSSRGYQIKVIVQRDLGVSSSSSSDCPFFLSACCEMLPRKENRVTIDPSGADAWGIPVARIDCEIGENERALARDAFEQMKEMAAAADFETTRQTALNELGLMVHEVGTARMGRDARTSVLNEFNRCWDVPNLYVTDGSCFVSSGWQNPTLTMIAVTVRACDHIVEQFRRGLFP